MSAAKMYQQSGEVIMPLPQPRKNEKKEDFISHCIETLPMKKKTGSLHINSELQSVFTMG